MNEETSSKRRPDTTSLRIMMQYFRGETLVCELRCAGACVNLHISRNDGKGEQPEDGWRVEAHGKLADEDVVLTGSGDTRKAALSAVGSHWIARGPELGLPAFDWAAVAVALKSVNAIE